MKKRLTLLVFVTLAMVLLVIPVLAAGAGESRTLVRQTGPKTKPHVISFTGTITDINYTTKTMSVLVQMTNYPFLARRGTTEVVSTTSRTVFYKWETLKVRKVWSFAQLNEGDKVSINALATTTTTTARRVEVNKPRY